MALPLGTPSTLEIQADRSLRSFMIAERCLVTGWDDRRSLREHRSSRHQANLEEDQMELVELLRPLLTMGAEVATILAFALALLVWWNNKDRKG